MTTNYTLFLNAYTSVFNPSVADPDDADWKDEFDQELRYSVSKKKVDSMVLDAGQSRVINIAGGISLADWFVLVVRCIGTGQIDTVGKDAGGGAITGHLGMFGTNVLPGISILSTYNLISITITSLANNSIFEFLGATCVEDGT